MSHHNSGPRAHQLPVADITDMYVFPAPDHPGRLVLVLDTVPYADPDGSFSDALVYRFRLRPLEAAPREAGLLSVGGDDTEITVDCTFSAPVHPSGGGRARQQGRCVVSSGASVSFAVGDETGSTADGVRVFAGPRWDPFFSDAIALEKTISSGRLAFANDGSILSDGKNVMSVVVEIDCAQVLSGGALYAVVGETVIAGPIPVRWERFGRPEMENSILGMKTYDTVNRDLEIRDLFNAEDAFHLSEDYVDAYRARLNANLIFWDNLDGKTDWPLDPDGNHPLTELWLADHLVVDVTKPFGDDTYLEIEQALLDGREPQTCGGRSPNNDSMDTQYTMLVNAGRGPRISDHVDWATKPATTTFPYLNPANPNPPAPPHHH